MDKEYNEILRTYHNAFNFFGVAIVLIVIWAGMAMVMYNAGGMPLWLFFYCSIYWAVMFTIAFVISCSSTLFRITYEKLIGTALPCKPIFIDRFIICYGFIAVVLPLILMYLGLSKLFKKK